MSDAMQHTPEPWRVGPYHGVYPVNMNENGGSLIVHADTKSGPLPNGRANEARIVACVNASKGLSNDVLEKMANAGGRLGTNETILSRTLACVFACRYIADPEKTLPELVKGLRLFLAAGDKGQSWPTIVQVHEAREALAGVEE